MAPRLELQAILEEILGGTNPEDRVYFQPPQNVQMDWPAIVYRRDFANTQFAMNLPYITVLRYQVTVIDQDPDSAIPGKVAKLPMCLFNRHFTTDNLNHDVYNIFF